MLFPIQSGSNIGAVLGVQHGRFFPSPRAAYCDSCAAVGKRYDAAWLDQEELLYRRLLPNSSFFKELEGEVQYAHLDDMVNEENWEALAEVSRGLSIVFGAYSPLDYRVSMVIDNPPKKPYRCTDWPLLVCPTDSKVCLTLEDGLDLDLKAPFTPAINVSCAPIGAFCPNTLCLLNFLYAEHLLYDVSQQDGRADELSARSLCIPRGLPAASECSTYTRPGSCEASLDRVYGLE